MYRGILSVQGPPVFLEGLWSVQAGLPLLLEDARPIYTGSPPSLFLEGILSAQKEPLSS